MNKFNKKITDIIKNMDGNVLGIGIENEHFISALDKNNKITICNLMNLNAGKGKISSGKKNKTVVVDNSNEIQLLNNYGQNTLMEVVVNEVPNELKNVKIKDSHLTDQYSINIVVIKRKDEYMFANKDTIIKKGDIITLFGPYKNIKLLFTADEKEKSL